MMIYRQSNQSNTRYQSSLIISKAPSGIAVSLLDIGWHCPIYAPTSRIAKQLHLTGGVDVTVKIGSRAVLRQSSNEGRNRVKKIIDGRVKIFKA
jgi:hypothetical protein